MEIIDLILINNNAYFYKATRALSKAAIERVFLDVSSSKMRNRYTLKKVKEVANVGSKSIYYSLCIFPYSKRPNFLKEDVNDVFEVKFSFLVVVEYANFVIVFKNNVARLNLLNQYIEPLDYEVISRLFVADSTLFEKLNVTNMNTSDTALRNRSVEAIDLKGIISNLSASKQVVSGMRIDNDGSKLSLALNTSRINSLGNKQLLANYFEWVVSVCSKISTFGYQESYLDIFARPVSFEEHRDSLVPICILLKFDKIKQEIEHGLIDEIYKVNENNEREEGFDFNLLLNEFDCSCQIDFTDGQYKINSQIDQTMAINIANKSIRLHSEYFNSIRIKKGENTEYHLGEYLNYRKEFIINFDETELIYTHGKLFKDQKLLGNLEGFLSVFVPYDHLAMTISEKGNFAVGQTEFNEFSIFKFIETQLANNSECLICDDLGNEWADYISIKGNSVNFFHAKHNSEGLSASKFQDVIGQAQKNLGYMEPTERVIDSKRDFWNLVYVNDNIETEIPRLRISVNDSIDDSLSLYKQTLTLPNVVKRVYLVIDFISKTKLIDSLHLLKGGNNFARRSQVLQILWFVSSLIASGKEVGTEIYIACRQ